MPQIQAINTQFAVNAQNSATESGIVDRTTGLVVPFGDLATNVWFTMSESDANAQSDTLIGQLHYGKYRWVQVSANATAANVKTGTFAFQNPGSVLQGVTILTAGSGQTAGSYNIAASGGGGSGATIQVVVGSGGTVTSAIVLTPGSGYTSVPTFTLVTGGTPGTVLASMTFQHGIVTSQDVALGLSSGVSPFCTGVFLNSITPGNWGFIQELGVATVISAASFTGTAAVGSPVQTKNSGAGTADVLSVNANLTPIVNGYAIDLPTAGGILFRAKLTLPVDPS